MDCVDPTLARLNRVTTGDTSADDGASSAEQTFQRLLGTGTLPVVYK